MMRTKYATKHATLARLRMRLRGHIGLLGGSFNPAHLGHAHIADVAASALKLDEIWWLVSPQNPHKSARDMAPLSTRMESAVRMAHQCRHRKRMVVSALEQVLDTHYTADLLQILNKTCPRQKFYFLMGADNFAQIHQWQHARRLPRHASLIVIRRPNYRAKALASPMAKCLRHRRLPPQRLRHRCLTHRPNHHPGRRYWCFIQPRLNPLSATAIRAQKSTIGKNKNLT